MGLSGQLRGAIETFQTPKNTGLRVFYYRLYEHNFGNYAPALLASEPEYSQFAQLFKNVTLTDEEVKQGITVFAPTNNGFFMKARPAGKRMGLHINV